jgi:hypothetical protein
MIKQLSEEGANAPKLRLLYEPSPRLSNEKPERPAHRRTIIFEYIRYPVPGARSKGGGLKSVSVCCMVMSANRRVQLNTIDDHVAKSGAESAVREKKDEKGLPESAWSDGNLVGQVDETPQRFLARSASCAGFLATLRLTVLPRAGGASAFRRVDIDVGVLNIVISNWMVQ